MTVLSLFPFNFPITQLDCRLFAVAVGAPDYALSQFFQNVAPIPVSRYEKGNGLFTASLRFYVVCLQNHNIRLATVNAGVLGEPRPVFLPVFCSPLVLPQKPASTLFVVSRIEVQK
jgi:hypothetical protein